MRPRLRLWHLFGLIAAIAAFLSVMNFRRGVDDPAYVWARQLRSVDANRRLVALSKLTELGPNAISAVGSLLEALSDVNPLVRKGAAQALFSIYRAGFGGIKKVDRLEDAKSALTLALNDPDIHVRHAVAVALAPLEPDPKVGIPALIEAVGDDDREIRGQAVGSLGTFAARGEEAAFRVVLDAIKDRDPVVRVQAIRSLSSPSIPTQWVPEITAALLPTLNDDVMVVRAVGVEILGRLASTTRFDVGPHIRAMSDPDPYVRTQAIVFAPFRSDPQAVFAAVMRATTDPDAQVRETACLGLRTKFYEDDDALMIVLRRAAKDTSLGVSAAARESIGFIVDRARTFDKTTLSHFFVKLNDTSVEVRSGAAKTLGQYGQKARSAVPLLIRGLDDPEPTVRAESARALGRIGLSAIPAIPTLNRVADDNDARARLAAKIAATTLRKLENP